MTLGYDTNFRVASQTVTGGTTLSIGYDYDGLLTSAGGMAVTRRSDNGMVSATTISVSTGTVFDEYTYDANGQLASYTASSTPHDGTATLLYSETIYTRDAAAHHGEVRRLRFNRSGPPSGLAVPLRDCGPTRPGEEERRRYRFVRLRRQRQPDLGDDQGPRFPRSSTTPRTG